jgi:hypothetical protein
LVQRTPLPQPQLLQVRSRYKDEIDPSSAVTQRL